MIYVLILLCCVALIYIVKYYLLTSNLKQVQKELEKIKQNPDQNRILLFSCPNKIVEKLLVTINEYIMVCRLQQTASLNRERDIKNEIEHISHDLRTPLTAILGYIELFDATNISAENLESLKIIEKKARYLQRLITNFYDLSRLELNDYQLTLENMDLTRFTRETLLSHFQEFEKYHLHVDLNLDSTPIFIYADYGALERIFSNVIQNALRYSENYFYISFKKEADFVSVIFENDTSVLSVEDASHLFERFYVKDASRTAQSTGLGLTISKLLTEAMGGNATAVLENNNLKLVFTFYRNSKKEVP